MLESEKGKMREFKRIFVALLMLNMMGMSWIVEAQDCDEFTSARDFVVSAEDQLDKGFINEAIGVYSCALDLTPDDLDILNARGIAYYES